MAKLTSKQRSALPSSTIAGPHRSYPIPDRNHAKAAIVDASRAYHAGHISKAVEEHIIGKAKRKLGS